jgi:hypothetical protein
MKQFLLTIFFTITAAFGIAEPAPAPVSDTFRSEMLKFKAALQKTNVCVWKTRDPKNTSYTLIKGDEFLRQLADPENSDRVLRSLTDQMHTRNVGPLQKLAKTVADAELAVGGLTEQTAQTKKCVMFGLAPAKKMLTEMEKNPASSNREWPKIAKTVVEYLDALETVK